MQHFDLSGSLLFLLFGPLLVAALIVLAVNIYTWRQRRQPRSPGQVPPARFPSGPAVGEAQKCQCPVCTLDLELQGRRATDSPRLAILLPLLTIVLLIMFTAGCSNDVPREWPAIPSDVKDYETAGIYVSHLQEFKLADGTRCVTAIYSRGVGIACDFSGARSPLQVMAQ